MVTNADSKECFARETLSDGEPSHAWNQIQLEEFAKTQHERIVAGETTLASVYHRLGRSLELLRRKRGYRGWGDYLKSLGIHRVRACKARAIARHFPTPMAVAEMAVEAAYEASKRKPGGTRPDQQRRHCRASSRSTTEPEVAENDTAVTMTREHGANDIGDFFADVCTRANDLVDAAAFAKPEHRSALIPLYQDALARLQELGRLLGAKDKLPPGKRSSNPAQETRCKSTRRLNVLGISDILL